MALSLHASFFASALAACGAALFTNPFEVVKTRLQLDGEGAKSATHVRQYRGIAHAISLIWRLEGVRGLQAGLLPALCYQTAMNGMRLGLYEPAQRALVAATGADPQGIALKAAAAAASGAVGATLGSPLYLIKSRLQAQSAHFRVKEAHVYRGLWDGLRAVHAAEGVRGLFRGLDGALPRVMTGSAVQLSSYDTCKAQIAALGVAPGTAQHLGASLLASVLTVTIMNVRRGASRPRARCASDPNPRLRPNP
jgi:solute carrier family 25 protein 34/35